MTAIQTTITPATHQDIPHIQHIAAVSWPPTYGQILSQAQLTYMLDMIYSHEALIKQMDNGHHYFILREQGQVSPMGFIDIEAYSPTASKLHKIYLSPASQGKGYGKVLIDFAMAEGRAMGSKLLKLNVNRHNKALGFYERMGFTIEETVDIPIGQGYYMNDYVLVRPL